MCRVNKETTIRPEDSKSSLNAINRFCDFKQNDICQDQFHHRLTDINKSQVPATSRQCFYTTSFKDLLYYLVSKEVKVCLWDIFLNQPLGIDKRLFSVRIINLN